MRVGVDAVSVDRVAHLVERSPRFVERVFTALERRDCVGKPQRWASSWAAKEAVRKLCASSGEALPAFRDVEVLRDGIAGPRVRIRQVDSPIALSLTHDRGLAIAVAASTAEQPGELDAPEAPPALVLPPRPDDAHKGTFGRVLVVAGSRGFTGAPQLAATGAARAGAGLVTLCIPEAIYPIAHSAAGRRVWCAQRGCSRLTARTVAHSGCARHRSGAGTVGRDRERAAGRAAAPAVPGRGRRGRPQHRRTGAFRLEIVRAVRGDHTAPCGDGPPGRPGNPRRAG
ncbi:MAG: 4'-phosphopantetheinyl transferase superfamily protein [Chloroflexi bacterium]|nr:MAG: 4'-phosphopantetheinyl transferase superfamily protein [Chloroflexota bacterium]